MPKIIDFSQLRTEHEPFAVDFHGQVYKCDTFDAALLTRMSEAGMKSAKDTKGTAHDALAAQINAVLNIPLEDLAKEDYRDLQLLSKCITDEIFRSGESAATKTPQAK